MKNLSNGTTDGTTIINYLLDLGAGVAPVAVEDRANPGNTVMAQSAGNYNE